MWRTACAAWAPTTWMCLYTHWQSPDLGLYPLEETVEAMMKLKEQGKIRAIGVSNFGPDRYLDIEHFANIKPAVNQVETHVFQQQKVAKEYLQKSIHSIQTIQKL